MPLKLLLTEEEIRGLPKTMLHGVTVKPNKVAKAQLKKVVEDIDYMSEACNEKGDECAYSTAPYLRVPMDYWKELRQSSTR